jgi:alkylation response protein AidB-like acyl-CoA dehydrogenase
MDFELTAEQKMLSEQAASFAKKSSPVERFRKLRSTAERDVVEHGWESKVWKEMAGLGWLGLAYPESVGGMGMRFFDQALVIEKLGATLTPEPIIASAVVAGHAVLRSASTSQAKAILEPMIEGKTSLALAWTERAGRYDARAVTTTAKKTGSGFAITGEKVFVENGHAADVIVVSAKTDAGLALFAVPKSAKGITVQRIKTMDGRAAAMVTLAGCEVGADALLGEPGEKAALALEAAIDLGAAAACAEGLGIATTVLDMTVAYLKTRKQFGAAIGTFQALQHRAVDMFVEVELLRSTNILAAVRADDDDAAERRRAISIAKAQLAVGGKFVVQQAIQLHGGIGITDEHDVGLYFKRMCVLNASYGDEEQHLARYASRAAFAADAGVT